MTERVDYSQLFKLYDPLANQPLRLGPASPKVDKATAWRLFKGEFSPAEPVFLKAKMGGKATDFLWSTLMPLLCVSERTVNLLLDNHFTGWATYPVEVLGRKGELLTGYYGFAVVSSVGNRDLSRSQLINKPPVVPGGSPWQAYKSIYFDEEKWDGSDIFRVSGGTIVVSRLVRDAFVRAKITNVKYTALTEVETNALIYEVLRKEHT